jgi:hypothetical protein
VHHYGLEKQPEPTIYAPFEQMTDKAMALAVRTTMDPQALVNAVKQAVWSVDRGQPVFQIRSMDDYVVAGRNRAAHFHDAAPVFAGISVLLAALGIHGVVSYGVAERTREFGIRMALGSTPAQARGAGDTQRDQDRGRGVYWPAWLAPRSSWRRHTARPAVWRRAAGSIGNGRRRSLAFGGRVRRELRARMARDAHRSDAGRCTTSRMPL